MTKLLLAGVMIYILLTSAVRVFAQTKPSVIYSEPPSTSSAVATESAEHMPAQILKPEDLTRPEEEEARKEFLALFSKRPINEPGLLNFIGFFVQYAVRIGVPANTIILILLLPFLVTSVVFFRQIIGLPTLEMLVPTALAVALIATGVAAGAVLLGTILLASIIARFILKRIRIMQLPKMALSMLIVSVFVFATLVICASLGLFQVHELSFLPVLVLILLSDKIVALQLARGSKPAVTITFFTLVLAGAGYIAMSVGVIRNTILLYPELILILIPVNILIGRYFGLRLTEYHRFAAFRKYVNQ